MTLLPPDTGYGQETRPGRRQGEPARGVVFVKVSRIRPGKTQGSIERAVLGSRDQRCGGVRLQPGSLGQHP